MQRCWATDPAERPTFLTVVAELDVMMRQAKSSRAGPAPTSDAAEASPAAATAASPAAAAGPVAAALEVFLPVEMQLTLPSPDAGSLEAEAICPVL